MEMVKMMIPMTMMMKVKIMMAVLMMMVTNTEIHLVISIAHQGLNVVHHLVKVLLLNIGYDNYDDYYPNNDHVNDDNDNDGHLLKVLFCIGLLKITILIVDGLCEPEDNGLLLEMEQKDDETQILLNGPTTKEVTRVLRKQLGIYVVQLLNKNEYRH